jgi:hypothetical protein
VIRIERVTMPAGLRALAHRDPNGDLVIYVSSGLDSRRQRAAIMEAVRASHRAGWRAGLPIAVAVFGVARLWLRAAVHTIRTQPAAWAGTVGGVAGVAAIAALVLVTGTHPHSPAGSAEPRPGSVSVPVSSGGTPGGPARPRGQVPPGTAGPTLPGGPGTSSGRPSPPAGRPSSVPSPAPSPPGSARPSPGPPSSPPPASPTPTPTRSSAPTPSPSPPKKHKPGKCVIILGLKVCLSL